MQHTGASSIIERVATSSASDTSLYGPMDFYGFLWIPMNSYGFLWIPMDSYGFLGIPMDSYEFLMFFFILRWLGFSILVVWSRECDACFTHTHLLRSTSPFVGAIPFKGSLRFLAVVWPGPIG
jgi:hypothetical protein